METLANFVFHSDTPKTKTIIFFLSFKLMKMQENGMQNKTKKYLIANETNGIKYILSVMIGQTSSRHHLSMSVCG